MRATRLASRVQPILRRPLTAVRRLPFAPATACLAPLSAARGMSLHAAHAGHDYPSATVKWDNEWIDAEAERIISKVYNRHNSLGDRSTRPRPLPSAHELEYPGLIASYPAKTLSDKIAYRAVTILKPLTHNFFRDKYNHHAVVLETVAAVPGMVGGAFRHLRSLRKMQRDWGWIHPLWEEAENERMHLLIWMKVTQPTKLEKYLVLAAQSVYTVFYASMYFLSPATAHRFVGYLEEEAVAAYTQYLAAIDSGALPNLPAPDIAKNYYKLPATATIRDVLLYVRCDECMHRCLNHKFSDMVSAGKQDASPSYPPPVPVDGGLDPAIPSTQPSIPAKQ